MLDRRMFSHANVPYRINAYESLVEDWYNTIVFDEELDGRTQETVAEMGTDGKLVLEVFTDQTTKVKLVGISGRSVGLERKYFEILDRAALEREAGFKIFAFHTALDELKPAAVAQMESMPLSYLPKGFDYYAGGHLHTRVEAQVAGYGAVTITERTVVSRGSM